MENNRMKKLLFIFLIISILAISVPSFALYPTHPELTMEAPAKETFIRSAESEEMILGKSEKLVVLLVPLDLKGMPLNDREFSDIVSSEVVASLEAAKTFSSILLFSSKEAVSLTPEASEFVGIGRQLKADVVIIMNIGRGRMKANVATHRGGPSEIHSYASSGPLKQIYTLPDFSFPAYAPLKNYFAYFSATSPRSSQIVIYSVVSETYEDVFQASLGDYISNVAKHFPLKKGRVVKITNNIIEMTLNSYDMIIPGSIVYMFPPNAGKTDANTNFKSFYSSGIGIRGVVTNVSTEGSFISVSDPEKAAQVKDGWIVEAFVRSGSVGNTVK